MASKKGVLAWSRDGGLSMCYSSPENRGKGRCPHTYHQEEGETQSDFIDRVSDTEEIVSYHMTDEEKENLVQIKGRKDLADENIEGGYIELNTPVWSPSNIKEFSQLSNIPSTTIKGMIGQSIYLDREKGTLKKISNANELRKSDPDFDSKYLTGIDGLNEFAAKFGYTATKDVSVLPYYMRQDTGDVKNPINVLYNALIVANNSKKADSMKLQECYQRLLDNKNVKNQGFKPLTSHGGFPVDSLADLVNGKSGIMRGYITGFSIPYSGRAVISPNIHLQYGEVGIPSKMAVNIFKPSIIRDFKENGYNEGQALKFISDIKNGKSSNDDIELLDYIMTNNDLKCLVNRQPSLHMPSMVCFKARVTEVVDRTAINTRTVNRKAKDVIHLNPMQAKGFNADHDGDTEAVYALNDKEIGEYAWDEMSPFCDLISHNPKNMGESLTAPTKDCLFGLLNILD